MAYERKDGARGGSAVREKNCQLEERSDGVTVGVVVGWEVGAVRTGMTRNTTTKTGAGISRRVLDTL